MKKISRMPTTIAALSLSWIVALIGLLSGLYLIFNTLSVNGLIIGISVLLAGLLLGVATRILANIGQMAFEMQRFVITSFSSFSRQQDNIVTSINNLSLSLTNHLQNLDAKLKSIDDNVPHLINSLNDNMHSNINNLSLSLTNHLQNLDAKLKSIDDNVPPLINSLNESLTNALENVITQLKSMYDELYSLKDAFVQANCDSRDINQNIYAIKDFFEKIEKHLDLRK